MRRLPLLEISARPARTASTVMKRSSETRMPVAQMGSERRIVFLPEKLRRTLEKYLKKQKKRPPGRCSPPVKTEQKIKSAPSFCACPKTKKWMKNMANS